MPFKPTKQLQYCCVLVALLSCQSFLSSAQLFQFATLKGNPVDTTGWDFLGTSRLSSLSDPVVFLPDEVLVCYPEGGKSGGVFYRKPINILKCSSWEVTFEFSLRGPIPGDGLAFCFLDKPPLANQLVLGEGIGIPQNAEGLKICIDTYNNSNDRFPGPINSHKNVPMVQIRWGTGYPVYTPYGTILADGSQDNLHGDNRFFKQPSKLNDDNSLDFLNIGTQNKAFHQCKITYVDGDVKVFIGNMVTPVIQTFIPLAEQPSQDGFFGFTSSTGGNVITPLIRNVNIKTNLPVINPGANGAVNVCSNTPVVLGEPPLPGILYQWSSPTGLNNPNLPNPVFQQSNYGPATVSEWKSLLVRNAAQTTCQAVDSVEVRTLASPGISFSVAGDCVGEAIVFTPITGWPPANEATLGFKWRFGDSLATPTNPDSSLNKIGTHVFSKPGVYSVNLTTTTAAGCVSTFSSMVTLKVGSNAGFSVVNKNTLAYCQPVKLVQQVAGGMPGITTIYPDYPSTKNIVIQPTIPSLGDTVTIDYNALGITNGKPFYVIRWVNKDAGGCQSEQFDTIILSPQPVVTFTPPAGICVNAAVTTINTAKETLGVAGFGWFKGPGIVDTAKGLFNPALAGVGSHTITFTFQSIRGCISSINQTIQVNGLLPVDFSVLNRNQLCFKPNVLITQNANGGMAGQSTIYLDYPATNLNIIKSPIPTKGTIINLDYSWPGITVGKPYYVIKWENTSSQGCVSSKTDTILVYPNPITQLGPLASVCIDRPAFNIAGGTESLGLAGKGWHLGRGIMDSAGLFSPALAGAGEHTIQYIFTSANNCSDTAFATQTVFPAITADAGTLRYTLNGGITTLQGSSNQTGITVLWTPSIGLSNTGILKPQAQPPKDQQYQLKVTSKDGCVATDTVSVLVIDKLFIPNVFSPNGDGINDTWVIRFLDSLPEATLQLFDRYGRTLFTSQGYNTPWDGKVNGVPVPAGVYYYILDLKNGGKITTGSVTVLR